jgi:hypothetical protein
MSDTTYVRIHSSDAPSGVYWITPERNRGQIVEVSYSTGRAQGNPEADHGDRYMRETDHATGMTTYYRAAESR